MTLFVLWSLLGFTLVTALAPWLRDKDEGIAPRVVVPALVVLSFGSCLGTPALAWLDYSVYGVGHALMMFLAMSFVGPILHGIVLVIVLRTAPRAPGEGGSDRPGVRRLRRALHLIAIPAAVSIAFVLVRLYRPGTE